MSRFCFFGELGLSDTLMLLTFAFFIVVAIYILLVRMKRFLTREENEAAS